MVFNDCGFVTRDRRYLGRSHAVREADGPCPSQMMTLSSVHEKSDVEVNRHRTLVAKPLVRQERLKVRKVVKSVPWTKVGQDRWRGWGRADERRSEDRRTSDDGEHSCACRFFGMGAIIVE